MHAFCLAAGSYFADLFTVEAGNGAYAFLPYLVTAAAVAILFAAAYFTFWRAQESRLLSRLRDADAVGQEAGSGRGGMTAGSSVGRASHGVSAGMAGAEGGGGGVVAVHQRIHPSRRASTVK